MIIIVSKNYYLLAGYFATLGWAAPPFKRKR